jgi:protein-S-isoprenylcysteine O-methyltransferase Ste14
MNSEQRNAELKRRLELPVEEGTMEASAAGMTAGASAAMVNRTHRVVRERAKTMRARRSLVRSLWLPLAVFSGILIVICTAVWTVLDEYEIAPTGIPDASQQMFVLLAWCLPMSAILLAVVWFRRANAENGTENGRSQ